MEIFHDFSPRNVTGANPPTPQRPYDVSHGQNRVIDSCLAKSRCWALNNNNNMKVGKPLTKIQKERDMNL